MRLIYLFFYSQLLENIGDVGGMETGDSVAINYNDINIMDVLGQIDDFMPMVGPNQPFQN